jgi:heme exporter protein C
MSQQGKSRCDAILWVVLLFVMILALYMAFIQAPREKTMGDLQRIFYFHVPAGMVGLLAFAVNFIASVAYLFKKDRKWDGLALASAESGVVFLAIILITGPIWAKPAWGEWWTWSPRLTSSLVLWLLYIAYLLIRNYVPDPERRATMSAVFGIIAFVDAPIVWFSIRWWRDMHPSAMIETGGLSPAMRPALWTCVAAYLVLMIYLIRRRYYQEIVQQELEQIERNAA